jgi:hypothetical protein
MDRVDTNIDEEKRGKLLTLAAFIALAIFVSKITQSQTQVITWRVYLTSGIYFLITFVGLLWAFNFQVMKKSILFLLQPALYVFSQAMFIEFFFFQKFNRIYEAFILLFLMFLVFIGNYVSFLMANVLNVDLFKKIPLAQVGRTSSYLISLLMMYFFTFSFLVSGFEIYFLLPLILLSYIFVVYVHYVNIGIEEGELYRKTVLTVLISFILFLGMFLTGDSHEIVSAIPVLGYYFSVGVVSQERVTYGKVRSFYFFVLVLIIIFLMGVFLNI